jgi:polyisoprenoid-binding protein YceI
MTTKDDVPQKLAIKASVKSFDSQNSNRDAHALEVLDALRFPDVNFSSIKFTPENNAYTILGNLEFHGIKQQKSVPLKIQKNGDEWEISGSFEVSLSAHEIDPPSFMLVQTKDNIKIAFDLIFVEKQNVK